MYKRIILIVALVMVFTICSFAGASADWGQMVKRLPPAMSPNPPTMPVVVYTPIFLGWSNFMSMFSWYNFASWYW